MRSNQINPVLFISNTSYLVPFLPVTLLLFVPQSTLDQPTFALSCLFIRYTLLQARFGVVGLSVFSRFFPVNRLNRLLRFTGLGQLVKPVFCSRKYVTNDGYGITHLSPSRANPSWICVWRCCPLKQELQFESLTAATAVSHTRLSEGLSTVISMINQSIVVF